MIDISKHIYLEYLLFGSLYFTEGIMKAISVIILPLYLFDKNISPELITLVLGITISPMIIKFIWGGIIDHYITWGRKKFILFGGLLTSISIFIIGLIDPKTGLMPFTILLFLCWCGVGFLDVSSDALAIDISKKNKRGKINGSMHAGQNLGIATGAICFPIIVKTYGYNSVFFVSSIIFLTVLMFPLIIKNIKKTKKHSKMSKVLIKEFKKKNVIKLSIFSVVLMISTGMILFTALLYMKTELKLDLTQIGIISTLFTLLFAAGALIGGYLSDRMDRKKILVLFIILSILSIALLILTNTWQNFSILYSIIGFLQGGYTAPFLALLMDNTNPRVGATQFSIYSGLANLGNIGTSSISGLMLVSLGYYRMFLYAALFFGPALLLLYFIQTKKK